MKSAFFALALLVAFAVPAQALTMADQPASSGGWLDGIVGTVGGYVNGVASFFGFAPQQVNPISSILDQLSISSLLCSGFGIFAGVCKAGSGLIFAFAGALILLALAVIYLPLFFLGPQGIPAAIVFAVVGAILGFFFGSVLNLYWWVILIIGALPKLLLRV